ncbi:MAG: MaoC family dehydratase N-terminal domain-containing protein [Gordonia sp. (in: high G+C Gram-positive bacteria)]
MTEKATVNLKDLVADWHPEPTSEFDELDPAQARRLAAALDQPEPFDNGDRLPLTWQWIYFGQWPPTSALGADGHPADGHFLPPLPHRRRMFAGARMTATAPMLLGTRTEKCSHVTAVTEKHGRSGAMLFVTVRNTYRQNGTDILVEDQDLVYRSDSGRPTPAPHHRPERHPAGAPWSAEPAPGPTTLFRYSALTANAHRIHYDHPYATGVEGYPDLVVHGPLLATYLAELARRNNSGTPLRSFDFRLRKPVFAGDPFRIEGTPGADGTVLLGVVSGIDTIHVSGTGELA